METGGGTHSPSRLASVIHALAPYSLVVAILACGEVWHLVRVNQALQAPSPERVEIGQTIGSATGFDRDGRRASVRFMGLSKSLVFCVSSGCPACLASISHFRRLASVAIDKGAQVVFISRDTLSATNNSVMATMPGTVISEPTYPTFLRLKLTSVPTTLVLSQDGKVENMAIGQLSDDMAKSLEEALVKGANRAEK